MNLKETCSYLGATAYRLLKLIASNGVHCRTTSAWLVSDRSVDQKDCFNPYHEYRGDGLPAMASDRVCANIDGGTSIIVFRELNTFQFIVF
mmetsp:Transcript_755/g.1804  ORF Transcript_755/g.1804 Transcript_755/m.1804 type:complete len:91 (-) Transcript_755:2-274(-)